MRPGFANMRILVAPSNDIMTNRVETNPAASSMTLHAGAPDLCARYQLSYRARSAAAASPNFRGEV